MLLNPWGYSALPFIERFLAERAQPRAPVLGARTLFTNMSDWNPAEIVGSTPRALAVSLYRELVTRSVWRDARAMMGYRAVPGEELMVLLAGQPFIDVRASLNSFLPAFISDDIGTRLVEAQVDRLADHPEFHDKLEFAVAQTAYDFTTRDDLDARYGDALDAGELDEVANSLRALTNGCLDPGMTGTLSRAEQAIAVLARRQDGRAAPPTDDPFRVLSHVAALIEEAREFGTRPFAILARHAFIAEALLRSAVARGALGEDRVQAFKRSFRTVAGDMMVDLGAMAPDAFMARYGHIRPGTYDILSRRYADRPDIFDADGVPALAEPEPFDLRVGEAEDLDRLIVEAGLLGADAAGIFDYARRAIVGREYGKFVFTRNLSDALEGLALWGDMMDMSRDDVSCLALPVILDQTMDPVLGRGDRYFRELAQRGREDWSLTRTVKLNYIIRDAGDLHVAPLHRAVPNYVGAKHAEGPVVVLDASDSGAPDLAGAVVCIENADPGFDWIFARNIAGLVTKFGGTNSHMAIRCAEFDLPAVIGCGEVLYNDLVRARRVEISCAHKSVRPV